MYHGDDAVASLAAFDERVAAAKKAGAMVIGVDGKKLTVEELNTALAQQDFFVEQKLVAVKNLLSRPKSKVREALVAQLLAFDEGDVVAWEGKKITLATAKTLVGARLQVFNQTDKIWSLVAQLAPDNNNAHFVETYEECVAQAKAKNPNSEPAVYIVATLLWQVQQLLDVKADNFRGAPFAANRMKAQASKFSLQQLYQLQTRLVDFDAAAKSGRLRMAGSEELLLSLISAI